MTSTILLRLFLANLTSIIRDLHFDCEILLTIRTCGAEALKYNIITAQANTSNMSQPTTREEIFARVHQETLDNWVIAAPSYEYDRWVIARFQEYEHELELPHLRPAEHDLGRVLSV